jgi:putative membrane protein
VRIAAYGFGLLGLTLLTVLFVREGYAAVIQALNLAGWPLLWLVPYRLLYFLLYAVGWRLLLQPHDPQPRAGFGYLLWATTVREAIDRLLPVASVGGGVAAVRLLRLRGVPGPAAAATVVMEVMLTVVVLYLFIALGLVLLAVGPGAPHDHRLILAFLLGLPAPVGTVLVLRYGSAFGRLQRWLAPVAGKVVKAEGMEALDREILALYQRRLRLALVAVLQLAAFISGSFEIWFALRLFHHPVSAREALVLESLTQAVRHFAFVVPAGIGVQEAALILFGQAMGIDSHLALAVSMAKRMRELLCGLPPLLSWQWLEGRWLSTQLTRSKAG